MIVELIEPSESPGSFKEESDNKKKERQDEKKRKIMKHIQLFEDFINEGLEVNTNKYQGAHGKKPSGNGMWAFKLSGHQIEQDAWTPNAMNYGDAVKWAKEEAKKIGATRIDVLS